jgi:hypothetical protein
MGMARQSLTQLQKKAYAQQCCSVWSKNGAKKNRRTESGGANNNLPEG